MHYEEMGSLGSFEYEYDPHKEQILSCSIIPLQSNTVKRCLSLLQKYGFAYVHDIISYCVTYIIILKARKRDYVSPFIDTSSLATYPSTY